MISNGPWWMTFECVVLAKYSFYFVGRCPKKAASPRYCAEIDIRVCHVLAANTKRGILFATSTEAMLDDVGLNLAAIRYA